MWYTIYMQITVDQIKQQAGPILKEAGIRKSSLFGSYARGDNRDDSDVDILIEAPEGTTLFDIVDLEDRLKRALNRNVDIVTYRSVSPLIKKYVFAHQVPLL